MFIEDLLSCYQQLNLVSQMKRDSDNESLFLYIITTKNNYEKEILQKTNYNDIKKAINTNNYKLALKNFQKIEDILFEIAKTEEEIQFGSGYSNPFSVKKEKFYKFIKKDIKKSFTEKKLLENWQNNR